MYNQTIAELAKGLQAGTFSSQELTKAYLERIKKHSDLNCFITVTEAEAMAGAKSADQLISDGKAGPLTGIPFAHKDIFCTQGIKTSCGSQTRNLRDNTRFCTKTTHAISKDFSKER